jgi:hypothetical protein
MADAIRQSQQNVDFGVGNTAQNGMNAGGSSIAMRMKQNKDAMFGATGTGGGQVPAFHATPGGSGAALYS